MKQVLVDMHRLKHNPYNGLYRFSKELGTAMSSLQDPDIKLHFYVPPHCFGIFGNRASYVTHRSIDKFYHFGTNKFDIWHATTTLSWYRPFNRKTKFVFTIHDLNFLIEEERTQKHKNFYLKRIQERVNRADYITYISEFSRQQALQYLHVGSKPWKVIYNGCNAPETNTFAQPKIVPAKPFLFSIGLFMSRKNFHVLPSLLEGNQLELVIAGVNDFSYKQQVLEAARQHGVQDRVRLVGPISDEEKFWYYQNCRAFLFPSIGEGFGLPIVEAMWFGKPVFLSTATCLPEIGHDVAYYFRDFDQESMKKTFEQGLRHYDETRPQEKIRQRAALFSWTKAAGEYMEVYRGLI
jgi:glycosyltransferase involved in cell wall biosynthesis